SIVLLAVPPDGPARVTLPVAVEVRPTEVFRPRPVSFALALSVLLVAPGRVERARRAGEREGAVVIQQAEDAERARPAGDVTPLVFLLLTAMRLPFAPVLRARGDRRQSHSAKRRGGQQARTDRFDFHGVRSSSGGFPARIVYPFISSERTPASLVTAMRFRW